MGISFKKISIADANEINTLAKENGGNSDLNAKNINHWYSRNPHNSRSLWKVVFKNKIEGYATSNNFIHVVGNKHYLVGFPQNVLTSNRIRGKGVFTKLYNKMEAHSFEEENVDFFLTFTGEMSTPIFENKFGYQKGIAPKILGFFFSITSFFSKINYKVINDVSDVIFNEPIFHFKNGRNKDLTYYKWRYAECSPGKLKILKITQQLTQEIIGYAFLIKTKKGGIPVMILADIIVSEEKNIKSIMNACRVYISKKLYPVLFMLNLSDDYNKKGPSIKLNQKSTFLVKGKTDEQTQKLSNIPFNFFFGDLDYFW